MTANGFLPTLVWFLVVAAGVGLLIEANENRDGTRKVVQMVLGAFLVLAFLANAWAAFSHWAYCEDNYGDSKCEEEEEEDDLG